MIERYKNLLAIMFIAVLAMMAMVSQASVSVSSSGFSDTESFIVMVEHQSVLDATISTPEQVGVVIDKVDAESAGPEKYQMLLAPGICIRDRLHFCANTDISDLLSDNVRQYFS
jgi:hypothetical protein